MKTQKLYHAFTRILTSPGWGSGMFFLVTLSLFRPPNPVKSTARISFESAAVPDISGSFAPFFSIICSVSSAISTPSFAMSKRCHSSVLLHLTVRVMLLQPACNTPLRLKSVQASCFYNNYGKQITVKIEYNAPTKQNIQSLCFICLLKQNSNYSGLNKTLLLFMINPHKY